MSLRVRSGVKAFGGSICYCQYKTPEALSEIFDKYGRLKDVRVVTFKDGKPKGLAYVEYETESDAATALAKSHGLLVGDRRIDVAVSAPPKKQDPEASNLGAPKRESAGGMRRTQLSSFIPSVLMKASTSTAVANGSGSHSNGGGDQQKRPMSNSDFRNMLLKK